MPEPRSGQAGHAPPETGAAAGGPAGVTHQYDLRERAAFIRAETVRLIDIAKTGHYTSVFSAAEILAALYYRVMRIRRGEPDWPERDRLCSARAMWRWASTRSWPTSGSSTRRYWTPIPGSATRSATTRDMRHVPGAGFSSGSLGHGLSVALGMYRIGIPDEYAPVGPPTHLYRHYGLDAPGILARIREVTADRG